MIIDTQTELELWEGSLAAYSHVMSSGGLGTDSWDFKVGYEHDANISSRKQMSRPLDS